MRTQHIKIDFQEIKDAQLSEFAQGVEDGLANNPAIFPAPPVPPPTLDLQRADF